MHECFASVQGFAMPSPGSKTQETNAHPYKIELALVLYYNTYLFPLFPYALNKNGSGQYKYAFDSICARALCFRKWEQTLWCNNFPLKSNIYIFKLRKPL